MNCVETRERVAAYRSGWLSSEESAALTGHLAGCDACRRQVEADARLCEALAALPTAEGQAQVPSWSQVRAAHRADESRPPRWLLLPAFGAAAAAAGLLWIVLAGPRPGGAPEPPPETGGAGMIASQAHMMMAASDVGGDPNRAIVAWYAGLTSKPGGAGKEMR